MDLARAPIHIETGIGIGIGIEIDFDWLEGLDYDTDLYLRWLQYGGSHGKLPSRH